MSDSASSAGGRITMKDVAAKAGVSRSAVSRTFTEGAPVSGETRKKILRAAEELGYYPSVFASSLTTRRTKLIGLVADNLTNPVFLTVIDHFTRLIQENGFRPLLINLAGQHSPKTSLIMLQQYCVDGVIIASSTLRTSFAASFREAGLPVVHTFGRYSGESKAHVVSIDNFHCGRMAAEGLLGKGYRDIEFLGGDPGATSTQDRLKGFAEALQAEGVAVKTSFASDYSYAAGRAAMKKRMSAGPLARAFFCGDDSIAIGAMDALLEAGFDIPREVGLIGFNDIDMAGWRNINLTTIRQPVEQIIATSVDLVTALIKQPNLAPETRLIPCEIVHRKTL